MKAELRVCDFCWNDDSRIVLAKAFWKVPIIDPLDDADIDLETERGQVDACAHHAKGASKHGIETQEIEQPELPYW